MVKNSAEEIKVLYIGHYKESSGWGRVTRDNILALDSANINLVTRSVDFQPTAQLPKRILELEQQKPEGCNICIQHVLPNYMVYSGEFDKNIGVFELETTNIKHTSWISHLNLMDEIWVPCTSMLSIVDDGVTAPVSVIPHACNSSIYDKRYPTLNIEKAKNKFVFYFIGEFNRRKHIASIIRAFHTEFRPEEPVELVLKVNKPGTDEKKLSTEVIEFISQIKDNLRIYPNKEDYKQEIIITVDISSEDILRLHSTCNCFVCSSFGEAWCHPAFEAMAMGNIVVSSKVGGIADYIQHEHNGFLIGGRHEPVFGQYETVPEFGTSREQWFNVDINELAQYMRTAYATDTTELQTNAKQQAKKYDYYFIGQQMREKLYA
jgi:glycosyltransferase involved in cell wall biosynthesis